MRLYFFLTVAALFFQAKLVAQKQPNELAELSFNKEGKVELKAGDVHKYSINLKSGQFARIRIKQETVGIGFLVFAPNDSLLEFTDLNALYQSEVITIEANQTGHYRIEVFWDYGRPQSGIYSIVWDKVEAITNTAADRAGKIFESWYDKDEPGAAVIVIKNKQVVFKSFKGLANLEYKIPISAASVFELASVSKQFTAFAIAMLIDRGQLSLNDSIRKFLPELLYVGKTITVRHLLDHTSGLRNWDDMMNASGYKTDDIVTLDIILKMLSSVRYLNFNPGEYFAYSNTGYNLLAKIVEKVTGQSFAEWMKENIFRPLDMNNTMIRQDIKTVIPGRVYCYKASEHNYQLLPDNTSAPGSSSVYSSVEDLVKWVNNFETGSVGGKNVLSLTKTRDTLNNGKTLDYAYGNFIGKYKGIDRIEHLGLLSGFRTSIVRFPEEKLAVIYLSNDANDATYQRASTIADVFLKGIKRDPLKLKPLPDIKDYLTKTGPVKPEKDTADRTENEGIYFARELNIAFTLKVIDGVLTLVLPRMDDIYLRPDKTDNFTASFPSFERRIVFQRDQVGKITGFILTTGGRGVVFNKLK